MIYDATVSFCDRFLDRRPRTVDQMVQAARSGRQNIAEGSRATATSSQTELRLINVARASLDELQLDYEDFLRQRGRRQWSKDDPEAREVRAAGRRQDQTDRSDRTEKEKPTCPLCKGLMVLRTAKKGPNSGAQFWGCANYPACKGTSNWMDRLDQGKKKHKEGVRIPLPHLFRNALPEDTSNRSTLSGEKPR